MSFLIFILGILLLCCHARPAVDPMKVSNQSAPQINGLLIGGITSPQFVEKIQFSSPGTAVQLTRVQDLPSYYSFSGFGIDMAATSVGGTAYVVIPRWGPSPNVGTVAALFIYQAESGWTRGPDPGVAGYDNYAQGGAAVSIGNLTYWVPGSAQGAILFMFDPKTQTWKGMGPSSMIQGPGAKRSLTAWNGTIFALGGGNYPPGNAGSPTNYNLFTQPYCYAATSSVSSFTPGQDNSWIIEQSMIHPRCGFCAATLNDKIYVFGGYNYYKPLDTMEVFDLKTRTWSTGSGNGKMPRAIGGHTCIVNGGKIYLIGGSSTPGGGDGRPDGTGACVNSPDAQSIMVFDPDQGWQVGSPFMAASRCYSTVVPLNF